MNRQINATEAKAKFLSLLDDVEKGEEIEITRYGKVVAKIAPARGPHKLLGLHKGKVKMNARPEDLYSTGESWNAM